MNETYYGKPSEKFKAWCKEKYVLKTTNTKIYVSDELVYDDVIPLDQEGTLAWTDITNAYSDTSRTNLTKIEIGNNVTSIGDGAFEGCSMLTNITIPSSVTSIGEWAFDGCSGLTSVTIPSSVTSIGKAAFKNCSRLTSITSTRTKTDLATFLRENDSMYKLNGDTDDPKTVNCAVADGNIYMCTYQYSTSEYISTYSGTLFQD